MGCLWGVLGEYLKTPLETPYLVGGMQTQTQTPSPSPEKGFQRKKVVYVKVRYYVGANNRLTFYIPMANDVIKEQVIVMDQKWVTEIIQYLKVKGRHYKVKHYGCSSFARMHFVYTNDVYVAKISAKRLLRMIKASKSWIRSEHASKIAQLLEQAGD